MALDVSLRHRFKGFDLDIAFRAPGGVTALFGHSGSGKTTIINAIAGLLRPDHCRVALDDKVLSDSENGQWLPPHKRRIGYVFQEGRLFPHLTVRGNLDYGRRLARMPADNGAFERIVEMLDIGALMQRRPAGLSGGEKQRVAIGRALLSSPELIAMDEPLASLDEGRKREILPFLERIRDQTDIPIIYVSHSIDEVARLANTLIILEKGRIAGMGSIAEVLSDASLAPGLGLREAGSLLVGTVLRHHPDGLCEVSVSGNSLFVPSVAAEVGSGLRMRIDAQDVILSDRPPAGLSALNVLAGKIGSLQPGEGPGVMVTVHVGKQDLLVRVTKRSATAMGLKPGMPIHAIAKSVAVSPMAVGGEGRPAPVDR